MMPFGNQSVTLLHREGGGYKRYLLEGCSWQSTERKSMGDNAMIFALETTCRIPANQKIPEAGDLLILGRVEAEAANEIALARLLDGFRQAGTPAFRVRSVKNNALGAPMPHYAAAGA